MTKSPSPAPKQLRRLLGPVIAPHRRRLAFLAFTSLLGGLVEAGVLILIARLAFALTSDDDTIVVRLGPLGLTRVSIVALLGIAAGLTLVRFLLSTLSAWQAAVAVTATMATTRRALLRGFLNAEWRLQSEERLGHLQELMTTYASHAAVAVSALAAAIASFLALAGLLGSALLVNPLASVVAGLAATLLALGFRPLRTMVRARAKATGEANLNVATTLTETSLIAQEIRIFGVEERVRHSVNEAIDTHRRSMFGLSFLSQLTQVVYQNIALMVVVGALGVVFVTGFGRLATLGAIVLIMLRSLSYGQALQTSVQSLSEGAPYLEALSERQATFESAAIQPTGAPVVEIGEISFESVSFEYEPGQPVLAGVSFSVRRGQLIGIIGPSGSGKSSLVQLLLRLREPSAGLIAADGRDVRELSLDDWYRRVTFVPQEPRLIDGTVADNIRFFRSVDLMDVERAAKLAHIHDDIVTWPLGYDTPVGDRGGRLSGGQRQRICIARSLVGTPDVLVFDEPTSSLDAQSEAFIRETLETVAMRTMVFVIAHRMSTVKTCDRIIVLNGGQLQHFDAPQALETSSGFFAEMLRLSGIR